MNNSKKNFVILALGSNLGDRLANLNETIDIIEKQVLNINKISSIYESKALLKQNSPSEWNLNFYNCVISGYTKYTSKELLLKTQRIEKIINQDRQKGNWSPREIDIDILAFNEEIVSETDLDIPHLEIENRLFVLYPLFDILPDWKNPKYKNYDIKSIINNLEKITDIEDRPSKLEGFKLNNKLKKIYD